MLTLIKNATLVNEGKIYQSDVLIEHQKIKKIAPKITIDADQIIDAKGLHLFPGIIDDQVHFREPDLLIKELFTLKVKRLWLVELLLLWKCQTQIHKS